MKKLLKIELERALKNKWFYICLLIGFAIVAKDIYSVAYNTRKYYYLYVIFTINIYFANGNNNIILYLI